MDNQTKLTWDTQNVKPSRPQEFLFGHCVLCPTHPGTTIFIPAWFPPEFLPSFLVGLAPGDVVVVVEVDYHLPLVLDTCTRVFRALPEAEPGLGVGVTELAPPRSYTSFSFPVPGTVVIDIQLNNRTILCYLFSTQAKPGLFRTNTHLPLCSSPFLNLTFWPNNVTTHSFLL